MWSGLAFPCPPLGLDLILDEENRLQFVDRETGEIVVRVLLELEQTVEALGEKEAALEQVAQARSEAEKRARQEATMRRQAVERAEQEADARRQAVERAEQEADARRQAEERAEQEVEARLQAEADGIRRGVEDLCAVMGLAWGAERSAQVEGMNASQLAALRLHLLNEKSWPEPSSDAPPMP